MKQIDTNYTVLEKTKHFFSLIGYIFIIIWRTVRNKWTWAVVGFITYSYLLAWFNSNYTIEARWKFGIYPRSTPIKNTRVVPVVKAKEVKPVVVAKTEEQIVKEQKYGDELWNIYMLESTRGKNDGCRLSGKGWGGFGVMGASGPQCYESFAKAVERASYWYEKIRKDNDLDTSLCIWNLGVKQPMCRYSQTYHSL